MNRFLFKVFIAFLFILPLAFLNVSCKNDSTKKQAQTSSVLVLLGSNIPYWNQIRMGIEHESLGKNLQTVTVFRESDTTNASILNALQNLETYQNLAGIIIGAGDSTTEQAVAQKNIKVPIIAVDQKPADYSPIAPKIISTIIVDNIKIAKEVATQIKEKQVVCVSYTMGGSIDRNNAFASASGKKIHSILASNANDAASQLQDFVNSHKDEEFAVFFSTGSFVNEQTIGLLKSRSIYTMDMNQEIANFIKKGQIKFAIVPNTYDMGAKAIKTLYNPDALPNQYVSVLLANKENIESDSIEQFLK